MKIIIVAGLGVMLGGCALLDDGASTQIAGEAPTRAQAPPVATRTAAAPFKAAYGIGRPVALVPCGKGARAGINSDCVAGNTRHQLGGGQALEGEEPALTEVTIVPVSE